MYGGMCASPSDLSLKGAGVELAETPGLLVLEVRTSKWEEFPHKHYGEEKPKIH